MPGHVSGFRLRRSDEATTASHNLTKSRADENAGLSERVREAIIDHAMMT
ncbi:MAG TPA: hypothetical protein VEF89_06145 [Solirubrobacteraceae bacterium]|nr:hypothetical protein [Solirubrobacteraceae bacterium]